MNVFVIVDRPIQSLFPAERYLESALLPLGGRPLLERLLTVLAVNLDEVGIVVPDAFTQTRSWLAANTFPPLKLHFTPPDDVIVGDRSLFIRGDIILSPTRLANALAAWRRGERMAVHAPSDGFCVVDAGQLAPTWKRVHASQSEKLDAGCIHAPNPALSARHYHALALAAAADQIPEVTPSGWLDPDGLRVGLDALVLTRLAPGNGSTVGARAFVDRNVLIGDGVVIGDDCVIGRGTRIANSVILPGVGVGKHLVIRNAIVGSDWMYRVDLDAFADLSSCDMDELHVA